MFSQTGSRKENQKHEKDLAYSCWSEDGGADVVRNVDRL